MRRSGPLLTLLTLALFGALIGNNQAARAGNDTEVKGAKIYCFMRSSGNDHKVSWNAAYAVIKRQKPSLLKTSPQHASVMITEAVVHDPGKFPDCGQFLGDLFGGTSSDASTTSFDPTVSTSSNFSESGGDDRYGY